MMIAPAAELVPAKAEARAARALWETRRRWSSRPETTCRQPKPRIFTLADLAQREKERAKASADVSYTRKLLDKGVAHCAKKFGEEAVETMRWRRVAEDRERVISEAADVLYHLVVLLEARGIAVTEVEAELAGRDGAIRLAGKSLASARVTRAAT